MSIKREDTYYIPQSEFDFITNSRECNEKEFYDKPIDGSIIEPIIEIGALHNRLELLCRRTHLDVGEKLELANTVIVLTNTVNKLYENLTGKKLAPNIKNRAHKSPDALHQLDDVIEFGKWKGHTVREVISFDPTYIVWADEHAKRFQVPPEVLDSLLKVL